MRIRKGKYFASILLVLMFCMAPAIYGQDDNPPPPKPPPPPPGLPIDGAIPIALAAAIFYGVRKSLNKAK